MRAALLLLALGRLRALQLQEVDATGRTPAPANLPPRVTFVRPAEGEHTSGDTVAVEFVVDGVDAGAPGGAPRVVFQLDGDETGYLCLEQRTVVSLERLAPGRHSASVTVGALPPATLSFEHGATGGPGQARAGGAGDAAPVRSVCPELPVCAYCGQGCVRRCLRGH